MLEGEASERARWERRIAEVDRPLRECARRLVSRYGLETSIEPADLEQEARVILWLRRLHPQHQSRDSDRSPGDAALLASAVTIARQLARNLARKARRHQACLRPIPMPEVGKEQVQALICPKPDPHALLVETERLAFLAEALRKLSAEQVAILALVGVEGRSVRDVAATVGISPDAVRMRINRAMRRIVEAVRKFEAR